MNDPHVEKLHYELITGKQLDFKDPPPIEGTHKDFDWRLEDGKLTLTMKTHFASEEEAIQAAYPFLRSWELKVSLSERRDAFRFKFDRAKIVDRNPPPPGASLVISPKPASAYASASVGAVIISKLDYPKPPDNFVASPDVDTLWNRFSGYVKGHEPLPGMAYFCLSMLWGRKPQSGKQDAAAKKYKIKFDVLKKLSELTSKRGDEGTARKADAIAPLTPKEERWIKAAVILIIRRIGEHAYAGSAEELEQLTMDDLPPLVP